MAVWKPIPGFEGYYIISNEGQVMSLPRANVLSPRILKPHGHKVELHLRVKNKESTRYVAREVLTAFVGPPPTPGHVARHRDGNKANNHLSNLYWGTQDWLKRKSRKSVCKNGHPFTAENTYRTKSRPNTKHCRECRAIWQAERTRKRSNERRAKKGLPPL